MKRTEIISLAISFILTGSGIFLGKNHSWGYLLVVLGIFGIIYVLIREVIERGPKLYITPGRAGKAAIKIYKRALSKGGTILATHIFPTKENLTNDFAVDVLKKADADPKIELHRILIVENPAEERRIVENLFSKIPDTVDITLHVLARYPFGITRLTKSSIPRFNLLLHQTESEYHSLLGLDDLAIPNIAKTNFAIGFGGRNSYESLKSYFSSITASQDLVAVHTISQYNNFRSLEAIPLDAHQAITSVIKFSEYDNRVLFTGLFGSIAASVNDIFPDSLSNPQDMDVDVLLVCKANASIDEIKKSLKSDLSEDEHRIIWGDDDKEFYSFRDKTKVNIDIEIFSKGDDFYKRNQLLSYSIFRYFLPLYSHGASNISDHIEIQRGPMLEKERWKRLIKDRKGFIEFKQELSKPNKEIDPSRVMSHILRNFVWAASGHYPATAKIAIEYLRMYTDKLLNNELFEKASVILTSDYNVTKERQYTYLTISATILDKLLSYALSKIDATQYLGEEVANNCIQSTLVPRATDT